MHRRTQESFLGSKLAHAPRVGSTRYNNALKSTVTWGAIYTCCSWCTNIILASHAPSTIYTVIFVSPPGSAHERYMLDLCEWTISRVQWINAYHAVLYTARSYVITWPETSVCNNCQFMSAKSHIHRDQVGLDPHSNLASSCSAKVISCYGL